MSRTVTISKTRTTINKKKKGKSKLTSEEEEAILAEMNHCKFSKCTQGNPLYLLLCPYCNRRYCSKHLLPEIHGCGQKVKSVERGKRFADPEPTKMSDSEKELAQARLHQFLKHKREERKPQQKKKS